MQVGVATLLVAGCPIGTVWWLRASGAISSTVVSIVLGMALSLFVSHLGCVLWEKQTDSEDLLFSELMVWGYLHRLRTQRLLASALGTLGPINRRRRRAGDGPSTKERAKLLEQLAAGMETRDPYLHGHSRRVARHAWMIARRLGLTPAEVARIRTAAAIHDVGKIKTPTAILHKAGPLTDEEYEVIKQHPGDGAEMATVLRDPELTSMVRHHHERLDGTGYPEALPGEEIPLGARIIAVADTFDAITSRRPYRPASAHKRAIDILKAEAGTTLDPVVVRAFCGHYAGRRPLAMWAFLAGLPERAVALLGGSAGGVASAAKTAAVAAIVGGTAVTSSTFALASMSQPAKPSRLIPEHRAQIADTASPRSRISPKPAVAPSRRALGHSRHAIATSSVGDRAPLRRAAAPHPSAGTNGGASSGGGGTAAGAGLVLASAQSSSGAAEATPNKEKIEASKGIAKSEETHGKHEEATSEPHGKHEETPTENHHRKHEETPAEHSHGKHEETPTEHPHGKHEETPTEHPHRKHEEATSEHEETTNENPQDEHEETTVEHPHRKHEVTPGGYAHGIHEEGGQ